MKESLDSEIKTWSCFYFHFFNWIENIDVSFRICLYFYFWTEILLLASGVLHDDLHMEWNDHKSIKHLHPIKYYCNIIQPYSLCCICLIYLLLYNEMLKILHPLAYCACPPAPIFWQPPVFSSVSISVFILLVLFLRSHIWVRLGGNYLSLLDSLHLA